MYRIGILIFPKVEDLDFVGPFEVLSYVNKIRPGSTEVRIVAETSDTVTTFNGLRVLPEVTVPTCPPLDALLIPGGQGRLTGMKNPALLDFIKTKEVRYLVSVCTGAFFLAEAGLLTGRRATTYHTAFDELSGYGVKVVKQKVVKDGNIITGAGVSSGIETGLVLLAELFGEELAQNVADRIEYCADVTTLLRDAVVDD